MGINFRKNTDLNNKPSHQSDHNFLIFSFLKLNNNKRAFPVSAPHIWSDLFQQITLRSTGVIVTFHNTKIYIYLTLHFNRTALDVTLFRWYFFRVNVYVNIC